MNRIKNELYKKWTYKKWNYKKWVYKKRTYKKRTYKKKTDPIHSPPRWSATKSPMLLTFLKMVSVIVSHIWNKRFKSLISEQMATKIILEYNKETRDYFTGLNFHTIFNFDLIMHCDCLSKIVSAKSFLFQELIFPV